MLVWIGHSPLPSQLLGLDVHPVLSCTGVLAACKSIGGDLLDRNEKCFVFSPEYTYNTGKTVSQPELQCRQPCDLEDQEEAAQPQYMDKQVYQRLWLMWRIPRTPPEKRAQVSPDWELCRELSHLPLSLPMKTSLGEM